MILSFSANLLPRLSNLLLIVSSRLTSQLVVGFSFVSLSNGP